VSVINGLLSRFELVVATQDWHPADHGSFAVSHQGKQPGEVIELNGLDQILWPVHCVQGTEGAAFHKDLDTDQIAKVFQKGIDPTVDSYSGFFDNGRRNVSGLADYLKEQGVNEVYVCGLATDYCVKFTALDARALGFEVTIIEDACRGVNLQAGDVQRAIEEMHNAEIMVLQADSIS